MENQHRLIKGYRDLSADDIALMNLIKQKAEELGALIARVEGRISSQYHATMPRYSEPGENATAEERETHEVIGGQLLDTPEEHAAKEQEKQRLNTAQPGRWLSIARTDLQTGIMALVRAVAQPTSF